MVIFTTLIRISVMSSARNFHNIDEGAIISFREKAAAEFIVTTF